MKFVKIKYEGDEGIWINSAHITAIEDRISAHDETFTEIRLMNGQVVRGYRQDAMDVLSEIGLLVNNRATSAARSGELNVRVS